MPQNPRRCRDTIKSTVPPNQLGASGVQRREKKTGLLQNATKAPLAATARASRRHAGCLHITEQRDRSGWLDTASCASPAPASPSAPSRAAECRSWAAPTGSRSPRGVWTDCTVPRGLHGRSGRDEGIVVRNRRGSTLVSCRLLWTRAPARAGEEQVSNAAREALPKRGAGAARCGTFRCRPAPLLPPPARRTPALGERGGPPDPACHLCVRSAEAGGVRRRAVSCLRRPAAQATRGRRGRNGRGIREEGGGEARREGAPMRGTA